MKTRLEIILMLFMSISLYGQEYRSLLGNAGWCCEYFTGTGAIYREFYVSETASIIDDLFGTEYLIQEDSDSRRVWYQNNGKLELIYDFSLIENDTFNITLHDTIIGTYTVTKVDTISTLSGNRLRWILYLNDSISIEKGILDRNLVWIEGIGSTYGPLYPKTIPLEAETWSSGTCLEAAYDSARTQIYQGYCNIITGYWPDECNFITNHIDEENIESSIAYFNATGDLEIISKNRIERVCIFDISGKQIYECLNYSGEGHLFIPNNLVVGVYICDLYDKKNRRSSIKVLKSIKSP